MSLLLLNDPGGIPRAGLKGLWSLPGVDPRINPGARWEQAARNLLLWSEDLANAVWSRTGSSVISDVIESPDGSLTADKLLGDGTAGQRVVQAVSGVGPGGPMTWSVYLKAGSADNARLLLYDSTSGTTLGVLDFSLSSAWSRKSLTEIVPDGHNVTAYLYVDPNNWAATHLYAWGAQLEVGDHATAYEKIEDRQSFYDFSYNGNHARSGSTTGKDTNDPTIVPTCRNELAPGSTEDLTDSNWTLTDATATATTFTPSAQNGQVAQSFPARAGIEYVLAADIASAGNTDLTWLHIGAAGGDTDPVTVSPTSERYNVTFTGSSAVGAAVFTGSGTNDATSGGTYTTGYQPTTYRVEIDGTGTPDTFKWSEDGGVTWTATGVTITGAAQTLSRGVTVTFGATTGHTAGDYWDISAGKSVSLGLRDANASGFGAITFTRVQVEVGSIATYYANPATESVVQGLKFEVDDYSYVANLSIPTKVTITALVKPDNPGGGGYGRVVDAGSAFSINNKAANEQDLTGVVVGPKFVGSTGTAYTRGQWHVVALVYNQEYVALWVDGKQFIGDDDTTPLSFSGPVYFGNRSDLARCLEGVEALVAIHSRPLSAAEAVRMCQHIAQQAWDHWGIAVRGYESTICQKPPMHLGE